jgi:hypothetical protein
VQRAGITVPEVAEEIRLHVSFREELLIATETGLAGRKELLVHLRGIEAGQARDAHAERTGERLDLRTFVARGLILPNAFVVNRRFRQTMDVFLP